VGLRSKLYDARRSGEVSEADLRQWLPDAWTRADEPDMVQGAERWLEMFRALAPLAWPDGLELLPDGSFSVSRGASNSHKRRMAWYRHCRDAERLLARHTRHDATARIWVTNVTRDRVRAYLCRSDEGPELILDPEGIGGIDPAADCPSGTH
jgi:hypothetical protein